MGSKQKGFSLIELLIVTVIILVIAAVAIPNLLRSRMSANEASAVASMRTVMTAEIIFSTTYTIGFSASLNSLADGGAPANCVSPAVPAATSACLIDAPLGGGIKNGYVFTYVAGGGATSTTFTLNADPQSAGSGQRHFFTDGSNVLRVNFNVPASTADAAL